MAAEKATPAAMPSRSTAARTKSTSEPDKPKTTSVSEKVHDAPPPKVTSEAKATPEPKPPKTVTKPSSKSAPPPAAGDGADSETIERNKFAEARRKAGEDPEIVALKDKADSAASEEEARQALRAYNKALYQKMRKLDSSIKDRIDATEAAIMRRLDSPN